jgi:hypothetical protein
MADTLEFTRTTVDGVLDVVRKSQQLALDGVTTLADAVQKEYFSLAERVLAEQRSLAQSLFAAK